MPIVVQQCQCPSCRANRGGWDIVQAFAALHSEPQPTQIVAHVTEAQRVAIVNAFVALIDVEGAGLHAVVLENALRDAGILKD